MAKTIEWTDLGMFAGMEPDEWVGGVNAARLLGYDGAHSSRVFRMVLGKNLHGHDTGGWSHSCSREFARRNFGRIEGRVLLEDGTWRDLDAPWGMTRGIQLPCHGLRNAGGHAHQGGVRGPARGGEGVREEMMENLGLAPDGRKRLVCLTESYRPYDGCDGPLALAEAKA